MWTSIQLHSCRGVGVPGYRVVVRVACVITKRVLPRADRCNHKQSLRTSRQLVVRIARVVPSGIVRVVARLPPSSAMRAAAVTRCSCRALANCAHAARTRLLYPANREQPLRNIPGKSSLRKSACALTATDECCDPPGADPARRFMRSSVRPPLGRSCSRAASTRQ